MFNEREQTIWTEKYRPQDLDTYIGNEHFKEKMAGFIESQDIPHLLLTGPAGTGKTTAGRIIVRNIDCDYIFINASDENNVETIRTKVKNFASSVGFKPLKIIVLDEADFITPQAQAALRNLMEAFATHTRFVLTANYKERLIDPIVSRTQSITLEKPPKKEVAKFVAGILDKEEVTYNLKDIALIVNAYYPDVRQIINTLQFQTKNGVLKVSEDKIAEADYKTHIIQVLMNEETGSKKFKEIRQIVADAHITDFSDMYRLLYDKVDEYSPKAISQVILHINEGQYRDALVIDKEINMMSTLTNILGALK